MGYQSRTFALSLENQLIKLRGRIRRYGFDFSATHPRMSSRILWALAKNRYERPEVDMICRHVKTNDRVLEVGICIGLTSLVLGRIVGVENQLLYEADPGNCDLAQTNFRMNGCNPKLRNRVLWSGPDRPDTVAFYTNDNPSSSSLLQRENTSQKIEVTTDSLEEVVADFAPTVICADIEGGEIDLFGKCHDFGSVHTILLETHARLTGQDAVDKMVTHLMGLGFQLVENHEDSFLTLRR